MNKKYEDQLIRCIKECWWRAGILLALIFGFVLLVIYGWPQGDWALGWGAVGAIGTIVVGVYAARISHMQAELANYEREYHREKIRLEIVRVGTEIHNAAWLTGNIEEGGEQLVEYGLMAMREDFYSLQLLNDRLDLRLLDANHLQEFKRFYICFSKEMDCLGVGIIANSICGALTIKASLKRLADASEVLVKKLGGRQENLRKFDLVTSSVPPA